MADDAETAGETPADQTTVPADQDAPAGDGDAPDGDEQTPAAGETEAADGTDPDAGGDGDEPGKPSDDEGSDAPSDYEPFKMPDGMELDEGALGKAVPILKELDLPQEGAQKLIDLFVDVQAEQAQKAEDKRKATVAGWANDTRESYSEEEIASAVGVVAKFASDDLKELLISSGMGDHKAMVGLFLEISKTMASDDVIEGDPPGASPKTHAEIFYGKTE